MYNRRVAVVGIGARGLALQGAQGAVGARVAASDKHGGRLRARRLGARGSCEGSSAGLAGFTRGGRGAVAVYMVRHIPNSLSSLQKREGSCCSRHGRCQHDFGEGEKCASSEGCAYGMPRDVRARGFRMPTPRLEQCVSRWLPWRADQHHTDRITTYTCRQPRMAHCLGLTEKTAGGPEWRRVSMAPGEDAVSVMDRCGDGWNS
jgi:hypothetical protein